MKKIQTEIKINVWIKFWVAANVHPEIISYEIASINWKKNTRNGFNIILVNNTWI